MSDRLTYRINLLKSSRRYNQLVAVLRGRSRHEAADVAVRHFVAFRDAAFRMGDAGALELDKFSKDLHKWDWMVHDFLNRLDYSQLSVIIGREIASDDILGAYSNV